MARKIIRLDRILLVLDRILPVSEPASKDALLVKLIRSAPEDRLPAESEFADWCYFDGSSGSEALSEATRAIFSHHRNERWLPQMLVLQGFPESLGRVERTNAKGKADKGGEFWRIRTRRSKK